MRPATRCASLLVSLLLQIDEMPAVAAERVLSASNELLARSDALSGLTFEYQSFSQRRPARALLDIAIRSQAGTATAALLVLQPPSTGSIDPKLISQGSNRLTIRPIDRFSTDGGRRVVLMLSPTGDCQMGATLWATVTLDGS